MTIAVVFWAAPLALAALLLTGSAIHRAAAREKAARAQAAAEAARAQAAAEKAAARAQAAERRRAARVQAAAEKAAAAEAKKAETAERRRAARAAAAEKAAATLEKQRAREAKQAAKLAAARELAEYRERALAAQKELLALQRQTAAGGAAVPPAPETVTETPAAATAENHLTGDPAGMTLDAFAAAYVDALPAAPAGGPSAQAAETPAPRPFIGHTVSFTGKLPGMTRAEAVARVRALGGRAFESMPAGTTLLVVGDKPGMRKLDKADEWIDQIKKITAAEFMTMLGAA